MTIDIAKARALCAAGCTSYDCSPNGIMAITVLGEALDALENDHNSAEEVIGELRAENARLRKALEDVQKMAEYVQERRHFQQVSQIYSAVSAALAAPQTGGDDV